MGDLQEWRDEWDMVLQGRDSKHTRSTYLTGLDQFLDYLRTEHPDVEDVCQVRKTHGDRWNLAMLDLGWKDSTRRIRLTGVKCWLNYLVEADDCDVNSNPFHKLRLPVPKEAPPEVIPEDDLKLVLKACKGRGFLDYRDEAMIRLMLDTGMRRGELAGINKEDLDQKTRQVVITRKGGNIVILCYAANTALALSKYLRARDKHPGSGTSRLFLSTHCYKGRWDLTPMGIGAAVARRFVYAGLEPKYPHKLRHTWTDDFLTAGGSEQDAERLGGWAPGSRQVKWYGSARAHARALETARRLERGNRL